MRRGDLYRVRNPRGDPKKSRVFAVASRQPLIDSRYSSVICAPIFSQREGLSTQVDVGPPEGLKHASTIQCDALMSLPKTVLTDYLGRLSPTKLRELDEALRIALALA